MLFTKDKRTSTNVFNSVPLGFFNYLASNSDNVNNALCLLEIYSVYDSEVSYRISRKFLRDSLSQYIVRQGIRFTDESPDEKSTEIANSIIRKFTDRDCGWLTEETDDTTYEKYVTMTEQGIALAEFLKNLAQPEREEYSKYIHTIFNTLANKRQWEQNPYINAVKVVYDNAKQLAKSLKVLSTFIRKKIEELMQETSLETLTDHLMEYCDGDFIQEYSRLTKSQNIYMYRNHILKNLNEFVDNQDLFELTALDYAYYNKIDDVDNELTYSRDQVREIVGRTKNFLDEDYERIMRDIKHKINAHIHIAIGRIRFIRNNGKDAQGLVGQVLKMLRKKIDDEGLTKELPEEMALLFRLDEYQFMDQDSLWRPRARRAVKDATVTEIPVITEEDIMAHEKEMEERRNDPYSMERSKEYICHIMAGKTEVNVSQLPISNKAEMLTNLAAAIYSKKLDYDIEVGDQYIENDKYIIKDFTIKRRPENK